MAVSAGLLPLLLDHLAHVDHISTRRMFGCVALFHAGYMFALVDRDDRFYVRADALTVARFTQANCAQFTYWATRKGCKVPVALSYFEPPEGVLDDPDELEMWVQLGLEAAART